jgi:hypothetical protein
MTVSESNETATLMADTNQSLRSSMNIITRDLMSAGRLVPVGGIPIPSGAGAVPLNRPAPTGAALTFPAGWLTLPAISPGQGLGPIINGTTTDIISILTVDTVPLCATNLALNDRQLTAVAPDGSSITVDPAIPIGCPGDEITPGDLIMLSNGLGNALVMVTGRVNQTLAFAPGDGMNLNQAGAAQGTVLRLQSGPGVYPPTTAYRVVMVSYYIDNSIANRPRLMRRTNLRADRPIGVGAENLQFTFDLVDGVTNPVGVPSPVPPNTPHQIRKANVVLAGRSHAESTRTRQFVRTSLEAEVSLRSLAFVSRYDLQ